MRSVLRWWRQNRLAAFGIVATTALLMLAGFMFDFRADEVARFLWACLLLVGLVIACAAVLFLLLLLLRVLLSRGRHRP